jgi:hypothetical protein
MASEIVGSNVMWQLCMFLQLHAQQSSSSRQTGQNEYSIAALFAVGHINNTGPQ